MLQCICGYKDSEVQSAPFQNQNIRMAQVPKSNRILSYEKVLWWAGNNTQMF
jgi:hypothetical protein